ncbi:hypothetical protein [Marivirga lumbricoides]|uniref:hypothetical protein n=1 Tax=Marivirga lumbricoides TaxID=1046115 RepID=UPI00166EC1FE
MSKTAPPADQTLSKKSFKGLAPTYPAFAPINHAHLLEREGTDLSKTNQNPASPLAGF